MRVGILQSVYFESCLTDLDIKEALEKVFSKTEKAAVLSLFSAIQLWMISIVCANRPYRYQPISKPLNSA